MCLLKVCCADRPPGSTLKGTPDHTDALSRGARKDLEVEMTGNDTNDHNTTCPKVGSAKGSVWTVCRVVFDHSLPP